MSRYASTTLASFMRTAESGSFAAAGRGLGISAAAVGQNVRRLEAEYGVKLFNRTTRKMSLTPEGSLLFHRARTPLRELEEIDFLFQESRGLVAGPLRISAPKRFAVKTLVPMLCEFRAAHPLIEIDLDASDNVRDFVDDPVDVAFRIGAPTDSTMIARELSPLPVYTMAAPAYLAAHGRPTHPQELDAHQCLQYRFTNGILWEWAFSIDGEIQRVATSGAFSFNDPEALLEAGLRGFGLFQIDGYYGGDAVSSGELELVMHNFAPQLQSLYLCYASRENMPLRVRAFIDFVATRFGRDCFILPPPVS
ncbi:MAG: LysR substrate-binding domain-containing protein [Pseudomonadota bacterium]